MAARLALLPVALFVFASSTTTCAAFHSTFVGGGEGRMLRFSRPAAAHRASSTSKSQLCMKTIAVFGASGLTGQECVYQALQNGDTVIGLTRYVRASSLV